MSFSMNCQVPLLVLMRSIFKGFLTHQVRMIIRSFETLSSLTTYRINTILITNHVIYITLKFMLICNKIIFFQKRYKLHKSIQMRNIVTTKPEYSKFSTYVKGFHTIGTAKEINELKFLRLLTKAKTMKHCYLL